jgi:hypothetical protein
MRGIAGRYVRRVEVAESVTGEGRVMPERVLWEGGRVFEVDEVLDVRWAHARRTSGAGMRYTVRVCGETTYLFRDAEGWFCEAKEAEL